MFLENLLGSQYSYTWRVVEVDALNFMAILSSCWVEIYWILFVVDALNFTEEWLHFWTAMSTSTLLIGVWKLSAVAYAWEVLLNI